jgi:uncharacterized protein (DUF362 family)
MKSRVSLIKGNDRRQNIRQALQPLTGEIGLSNKKNIFIKPNFVSSTNQLASTHVDGVRALLEFLRERYNGRITIGEGAEVPTREVYKNFGYLDLVKEYKVELIDLSEGEWVPVDLYDAALRPMRLRYSKPIAESDYRIVINPPKTHDVVVATLTIKNLAMGALYCKPRVGGIGVSPDCEKIKMHQGHPVHNLNLYLLTKIYPPHLSIIDGYLGMEGDGPVGGTQVKWGIAVASQDPVAADCLTAHLMGFPITETGYLWYCDKKGLGNGDLSRMEIIGADPQQCIHHFAPPPTYEAQKKWRDARVAALIGL